MWAILNLDTLVLNVPFLNYLGGIRSRAGMGAQVRVGGNSQETSLLYMDGFPNHEVINKTHNPDSTNPVRNTLRSMRWISSHSFPIDRYARRGYRR